MKPMKRLISSINRGTINPEAIRKRGAYYGDKCLVTPLFCSYGQIGYVFDLSDGRVTWDYEKNTITY